MGFISAEERALPAALSRLGYANPFLPERIEAEGAALGPAFVHADRVWSVRTDRTVQNPNVARLAERATTLAALLRERLAAGAEPAESDRVLYEDVVLYLLYTRYEDDLLDLVVKGADAGDTGRRVPFYEKFRADCQHFLDLSGAALPGHHEPAHLFACLFQVRRAFHHIFWHIIGGSMSMARLRAAVWQSIFTHDMRRYRRAVSLPCGAAPPASARPARSEPAGVGPAGRPPPRHPPPPMAPTNRDGPRQIQAGRFREDFYSRLCSAIIAPPPLAEQLRESPDEPPNLSLFLARRLVGDEEAEALADEVQAWIEEHLGPTYPWPGNVRELEQCVRNVLIRGEYRPPTARDGHPEAQLAAALRAGELTADQLLARYCALVYAETRSNKETARRHGLDRRTERCTDDQIITTSRE